MKRFLLPLLIISLIMTLFACNTGSNNSDNASNFDKSTDNTVSDGSVAPTDDIGWFASYYRVGWGEELSDDPIFIRSVSELQEYAAKFDLSDDSRLRKDVFDNNTKYNDAFFSRRLLLIVYSIEGSGSVRHKVSSVEVENGTLKIDIDRHSPGEQTADMAYWQIFIEADVVSTDYKVDINWQNVQLDSAALSPPASELKRFTLEKTQENDKLYAVFNFSGIHSRLYPQTFDTWHLTRDNKILNGNDYGVRGDEYEYYERVIENGETTFYVPISLYKELPGSYVFSVSYQNKTFFTEPLILITD